MGCEKLGVSNGKSWRVRSRHIVDKSRDGRTKICLERDCSGAYSCWIDRLKAVGPSLRFAGQLDVQFVNMIGQKRAVGLPNKQSHTQSLFMIEPNAFGRSQDQGTIAAAALLEIVFLVLQRSQ